MNIWIGGDVGYVEVGGEQQAEWVGKNPERRVTTTENQAEILSCAACVEVNGGNQGTPRPILSHRRTGVGGSKVGVRGANPRT